MFGSVLTCAKSAHVFQKLSYSFCGLCLSLSPLITLPQTVRLFYVSLRSQAPQQQYTVLSFLRCEGMATVTNSDLFTCTMVGLPTKKSKVLRFQICCTRTKYLSEIYKSRTIKVGAAKLFSVNSSWTWKGFKCQKLGAIRFK